MEQGRARAQAGAGIVADSRPEAEEQETRAKSAAILQALEVAEQFARAAAVASTGAEAEWEWR
jgi:anthranilate synthase component 1